MGLLTCNGAPVISLRMVRPALGCWIAELAVDAEDGFDGQVEIVDEDGPVTYSGAVVRGGVVVQTWSGIVVGGTGGLRTDLPARHYQGATVREIATDLLRAAGEALDATSTPAILGLRLDYWSRPAGNAKEALTVLSGAAGATWRVLPSGRVWIGTETWPAFSGEILELDRNDQQGTVELAPDSILLGPGVTLADRRVGRVEHRVDAGSLRSTHWIAE